VSNIGTSFPVKFRPATEAAAGPSFLNKKKRATGSLQGPLIMKVKNLQRGTAAAVELGGKSHHVHQLSAIWWFFVQ
jgi:hypothetical protein